jgi:phosphoglucomutase
LAAIVDDAVTRVVDLERADIPADVVVFYTARGTRLTVRPSGTEPKVKFYLEQQARATTPAALRAAERELAGHAKAIRTWLDVQLRLV